MKPPSIFRYPGGKTRFLPAIRAKLLPLVAKADVYADYFVGGGSVLIDIAMHSPSIKLLANDKDKMIYSFWAVIASGKVDALIKLLDRTPTIDEFYKLREAEPCCEVERAFYAVYFNRTTFSGIGDAGPIGGEKQSSKYTIDCRYNRHTLIRGVETLARIMAGRLTVTNDYITDIEPDNAAAKYYDPPYYAKGKELYRVWMTHDEHKQLAEALSQARGWVASYDDCEPITNLYRFANIERLGARYSIGGKKTSWAGKTELLICAMN